MNNTFLYFLILALQAQVNGLRNRVEELEDEVDILDRWIEWFDRDRQYRPDE